MATLCVVMATIGIFLPVLPTTPLLLLAIWLYMRSSKKGVKMILSNRRLAPYVHSYFSRNGIEPVVLKRILLTLWLTISAAMAICRDRLPVVAILLVCGIGVTIHLYLKRQK